MRTREPALSRLFERRREIWRHAALVFEACPHMGTDVGDRWRHLAELLLRTPHGFGPRWSQRAMPVLSA